MKTAILRIPWAQIPGLLLSVPIIPGESLRVLLPQISPLARVIGVWEYHQYAAIDVLIEDESFAEVPQGCGAPVLEWSIERIRGKPEWISEERLSRMGEWLFRESLPGGHHHPEILAQAIKNALEATQ